MKSLRFWLLVLLVVVARIVSFCFLKADPAYLAVPRSFVGGGFQTMPALLDLAIPAMVVYCLWPGHRFGAGTFQSGRLALWDAVSFHSFPLIAGLSLFAYLASWQIFPHLDRITSLRWLEFIVSFVAWNMLLDELAEKRLWQRIAVIPVLALSLGMLQDAFPPIHDLFRVLLSVGMTLTWTVLALRRRYGQSPLAATAAAALIGAVSCMLVVMAPADSMIPALLLPIAFLAGALTINSRCWWPRWVALASIAAIGLLLSLALPRFLPPEQRAAFLNQEPPPAHSEQVEGITVRYDDIRVRPLAIRLAHVLAAANQVSREAYGVSPEVNELVIRGFESGGFQARFPHGIDGNLPSPRYVDLCLDSSYLNDPNASIHFPDPVNAILHEYSHLYGTVPYNPWIMGGTEGSEEEGWATFSATRLSRRLYDRFGAGLWTPAYNYAARAEAITQANLDGHSVYWSHDNEYGGFRLWYLLSRRDGEAALYRKRWELTRRDGSWWFQINRPDAARKAAAAFGRPDFVSFGSEKAVRYDQVHTLQDLQSIGELLGWSTDKIKANYALHAADLVDPAVRVPARGPVALDIALSALWLALGIAIRRVVPAPPAA
ncbi:MAG: hypothetical protein ACLQGT_15400 [Terracidiphilus sp.]